MIRLQFNQLQTASTDGLIRLARWLDLKTERENRSISEYRDFLIMQIQRKEKVISKLSKRLSENMFGAKE